MIMELEELKNRWSLLEKRLQSQDTLKEHVIREILLNRSEKGLGRMINYGYFGIALALGIIALFAWQMSVVSLGVFHTVLFSGIIILLVVCVIMETVNLITLHKMDFSKPVNHNLRLMQKHNISLKRQLIGAYVVAVMFAFFAVIAGLMTPNMELWRWCVFIASLGIGIAGGCWEYKRMYRRNMDSILRSLQELREIEE
jgi:hypothetical protein